MQYTTAKDTKVSRLIRDRAELLITARELLWADAQLMGDLGNHGCDYCVGSDEKRHDGHSIACPFADMVEILFRKRTVGEEAIRVEALEIRDAIVNLMAADYHMMGMDEPCPYCESEFSHRDNCVITEVLEVLTHIPREVLV